MHQLCPNGCLLERQSRERGAGQRLRGPGQERTGCVVGTAELPVCLEHSIHGAHAQSASIGKAREVVERQATKSLECLYTSQDGLVVLHNKHPQRSAP